MLALINTEMAGPSLTQTGYINRRLKHDLPVYPVSAKSLAIFQAHSEQ